METTFFRDLAYVFGAVFGRLIVSVSGMTHNDDPAEWLVNEGFA